MNFWAAFQQVIQPQGPLMIGEVTAIYNAFGDVQADVQILPGAAIVRVKAPGRSLEIGQRWLIQDGSVVEEAPNTTVYAVTI